MKYWVQDTRAMVLGTGHESDGLLGTGHLFDEVLGTGH